MHSLVQPNSWAVLRLPSGNLRVLEVIPNTTISLGKYGCFPTNLIIERPYHLTYELLDRRPDEKFNRLRIVPPAELYADILSSDSAKTPASGDATPAPDAEGADPTATDVEYSLVDADSGAVVATTDRAEINAEARQTLTVREIEAMKKDGTDAGRELITKLMLSHTAIDQKTEYSLAKYKLLKTRKYIRRFSVMPLDVPMLNYWQLEDKDPAKIMDMREEMLALLGCWANVHFGGTEPCEAQPVAAIEQKQEEEEDANMEESSPAQTSTPGRWLVVDDTGGLLVAALAERMGILYPSETDKPSKEHRGIKTSSSSRGPGSLAKNAEDSTTQPQPEPQEDTESKAEANHKSEETAPAQSTTTTSTSPSSARKRSASSHDKVWRDDTSAPYAGTNTITHIHANSQPNLSLLRFYDFDITNPSAPSLAHPLSRHLMSLSWLQLLQPQLDATYSSPAPHASQAELYSWKTNRRSAYHKKRKRWLRTRHIVDTTRAGGFSGLVVASSMDAISVMRYCVPLLAGGASIAIYSPSIEPLAELADCYSISRRAAWAAKLPDSVVGLSPEEQARWEGDEEFPLNPSLVLGASIQTSRVRRWQVLPGRTHPLMSGRGGAEGYVFTAWRVRPAEGKVEARGKPRGGKKRKVEE
ncbi:eukaryotic translation initiation factor gamma [Nemania sp. FL0916]|nr:eukaryotic translation initiation factor gamma [Nemania sp. FL0916]